MSVFPSAPSSGALHWADGSSNVVEPTDSKKTIGWALSESPASGFVNWINSILFGWVNYFKPRVAVAFVGDGHHGDCALTGTITWTGSSATVTGTGTNFQGWMIGCTIELGYQKTPGTISAVVSPTQLTLSTAPGGGGVGQAYAIMCVRDQDFATLEIDAGNVLKTGSWRIRAALTVRLNGTISANGPSGHDANPGGSPDGAGGVSPKGSLVGGTDGSAGGFGHDSVDYGTASASLAAGLGGQGGSSTGASAGTVGGLAASVRTFMPITTGYVFTGGAAAGIGGGTGGVGGASHASPPGGTSSRGAGGGAGGGVCMLICGSIAVGSTVQTGTLSGSSSTTITGTGTNFLTLAPGTVITVNGSNYKIVSIASATSMTVHAVTGTFASQAWSVVGAMTATGGNGGAGWYINSSGVILAGEGGAGGGGGCVFLTYLTKTGTITYITDGGLGGSGYDASNTVHIAANGASGGSASVNEVAL